MVSIYEAPLHDLTLPDEANSIVGEPFECLFSPERFERGDLVVVCHDRSTVMGYIWVSFKDLWVCEARLFLSLREDEAVSYDLFVFPRYRGRRIRAGTAPAALAETGRQGDKSLNFRPAALRITSAVLAEAGRRGRRRVITCTESYNTNSLKLQQRIGGIQVMSVYSIHLFDRFSLHWATGRPLGSRFYK
jgi:GNAT superfamily N-acetyltransferase